MKIPHLWRVDRPASEFTSLFRAFAEAKLRIGWLVWSAPKIEPALEEATVQGALRAVAVGDGWSVAVKRMSGPPVPRDLLREHFRGCQLVLIHGEVDLPLFSPAGNGRWSLATQATPFSTAEAIRRVRKPSPHQARELGSSWQRPDS